MASTFRRSLIAAAFVAVSFSSVSFANETSLYDRLGGKPALNAVVNELWNLVAADARINGYFAHTKPEVFGSQLVDFLCQASGGPCEYKGQDMKAAHTGMKLSDGDFTALAENTVKALDKFNVPAAEKAEVMGLLSSLHGDVVGH